MWVFVTSHYSLVPKNYIHQWAAGSAPRLFVTGISSFKWWHGATSSQMGDAGTQNMLRNPKITSCKKSKADENCSVVAELLRGQWKWNSLCCNYFPNTLLVLFNLLPLNRQQFFRAVHINAEIISPGAGFKTQKHRSRFPSSNSSPRAELLLQPGLEKYFLCDLLPCLTLQCLLVFRCRLTPLLWVMWVFYYCK